MKFVTYNPITEIYRFILVVKHNLTYSPSLTRLILGQELDTFYKNQRTNIHTIINKELGLFYWSEQNIKGYIRSLLIGWYVVFILFIYSIKEFPRVYSIHNQLIFAKQFFK